MEGGAIHSLWSCRAGFDSRSGGDSQLGGNQSPETFFWMRFSFAAVTVVSAICGVLVALRYPITKERALETRRLLEERRGLV